MATTLKDVIVICLDVGLGMQQNAPGIPSALDKSISIISMLIQRKMFASSKDLVALVTFGSEETSNQLADKNGDSYSNICVIFPLGVATFTFLEYVSKNIRPGNKKTDFLDAVTVCLDLLYNNTRDLKINSCRLVLFSNFDHQCNDDNIDGIISSFTMRDMNVEFNIIGPGIDIEQNSQNVRNKKGIPEDSAPSTSKRRKLDYTPLHGSEIDDSTLKPKSLEQLAGENVVCQFFQSGVFGMCYSYSHVNEAVTGFEKRAVRSAAWKCNLSLGEDLCFPCVAYSKTKEAKLKQSWKKCHAKTHKTEDIMQNQYYHANDEEQTEVAKQNVGKGYKYGKDVIPFSAEDEKQMKYQTEGKCLSILGFSKEDTVSPSIHMDDQAHFIFPENGNSIAAVGLQALVVALHRQGLCAIASYIYRRGSNPKLVALLPRIRIDYKCLIMISLPFSEDIRPLSFPFFNSLGPTELQLDSVDKLIQNMDLSNTSNSKEFLNPKQLLNPFFQHTFRCLHQRSMNPRNDFVNFDENVWPPDDQYNVEQSYPGLNFVVDAFTLQRSNADADLHLPRRWKNFNKDECPEAKATSKPIDEPLTSLAIITAPAVTSIGTVSPDTDFVAMIANSAGNEESVSFAFQQLQNRIEDFLNDPFTMKLSNKILVCFHVLASHAEQFNQVDNVNTFLLRIKEKLQQTNVQLWKLLINNDVNIVGNGDYDGINRSNFCLEVEKSNNVYKEDTEREAEDLLAMID